MIKLKKYLGVFVLFGLTLSSCNKKDAKLVNRRTVTAVPAPIVLVPIPPELQKFATSINALNLPAADRSNLITLLLSDNLTTDPIRSDLIRLLRNILTNPTDRSHLITTLLCSYKFTTAADRSNLITLLLSRLFTDPITDRHNLITLLFSNTLLANPIDRSHLISLLLNILTVAADRSNLITLLLSDDLNNNSSHPGYRCNLIHLLYRVGANSVTFLNDFRYIIIILRSDISRFLMFANGRADVNNVDRLLDALAELPPEVRRQRIIEDDELNGF